MLGQVGPNAVLDPLVLGGASIIASIIGTFFVKAKKGRKIMNALRIVLGVLVFHSATASRNAPSYVSLVGLILTALMVVITEYYTATEYAPVRPCRGGFAKRADATNIIAGLAVATACDGAASALPSAASICWASYDRRSLRNCVAVISMLSMYGNHHRRIGSLGPITDNAGGIAVMAELPAVDSRHHGPIGRVGEYDGRRRPRATRSRAGSCRARAVWLYLIDLKHHLQNPASRFHMEPAQIEQALSFS